MLAPHSDSLARTGCRTFSLAISPVRLLRFVVLGAMWLGVTCAPAPTSPGATPAAGRFEALAGAYHVRGEFDGVVLVAEGEQIRYLGAFGPSTPAADAPAITAQTVFPICSITKQFTAVLLLQLVDAGKLRLDSTLGELLPDFRQDEAGRAVTVRQLLTHSSGLPSLEAALPEQDGVEGFYRLADIDFAHPMTILEKYLRGPLRFAAGTRFEYNNADYWVLGVMIERLGEASYEAQLNQRILIPLGLRQTGLCTPSHPLPAESAQGRVRSPQSGTVQAAPDLRLENFWAAGAMFANAEDLLRWDAALDGGKLLSPAMQTAMFTPDLKLGFVALSSWVYRAAVPGASEKVLLVERQGEIAAFHALTLRLPEQHGHVILLSNLDTADLNSTYMKKGLPFALLQTFFQPPVDPSAPAP